MLQNVEDTEEILVNKELSYLLHIRKKGKEYDRAAAQNSNLAREFRDLMNSYSQYDYNPRVLVQLIETGHC